MVREIILNIEAFKIPLIEKWIEKHGFDAFVKECERLRKETWRVK